MTLVVDNDIYIYPNFIMNTEFHNLTLGEISPGKISGYSNLHTIYAGRSMVI